MFPLGVFGSVAYTLTVGLEAGLWMRHSDVLPPPPPHESAVKRSPLSGSIESGSAHGMLAATVWITLAFEGSSCNTAPVV